MQNFLVKFVLVAFIFVGLLTSCEEDGGDIRFPEPEAAGPSISLLAGPNQISSDATIAAGSIFTVQVSAQAGEAVLDVFTVTKNGVNVPFENLQFDKSDVAANPVLILNEDYKLNINWVIQITTDGDGSDTYSFEVKDETSKTASTSLFITQESLPPNMRLVEETPYFWEDKVCPIDTRFTVRVLGEKGTADIQTIAVYENGELITDLTRIQINGFDLFDNPVEVADDSKQDFDFEVNIQTSSDFGTKNYEIIVTDESGQTSSVSLNVTTGTSVTTLNGKLLLNRAGPSGTGGINLLTGQGVGSGDETAHLLDEGINTDLPAAENWKQQISGANGAVIRILGDSQPETFDYDNVELAEQITDIFNAGQDLVLTNSAGVSITDKIQEGNILTVQKGDVYFLLRVDRINISTNDNADFYELSIKY